MLKCEQQMQQDVLKATVDKIYKLNHYEELKRIVAFSFIKNLNNTLKEESTTISVVRHDYVLLYTIWAIQEFEKKKIVDFAISIDIDSESDTYTVTDCYATTWLQKDES